MFGGVYRGRRVLLTGHTGFKGSWLALWLQALGAQVSGVALDPDTQPCHFDILRLQLDDVRHDIREPAGLRAAFERARPELVFHLAAQPLVRASYADPIGTWSTNVMGTANVLEACRAADSVRAVVVVTTDKCYENVETDRPYREHDPLGGHDPYSASKAAAELVAQSWRRSFFAPAGRPLLATARAGNVIGGGDWSRDRLVPDVARATLSREVVEIRSPAAVRPWQHVLDSLSGYLLLGERLLRGDASVQGAWNFGPVAEDACSVEAFLERLQAEWPSLQWTRGTSPQLHEAGLLRLDISKARHELAWSPVWRLGDAISATARWYRAWIDNGEVHSAVDLESFISDARAKELPWAIA